MTPITNTTDSGGKQLYRRPCAPISHLAATAEHPTMHSRTTTANPTPQPAATAHASAETTPAYNDAEPSTHCPSFLAKSEDR